MNEHETDIQVLRALVRSEADILRDVNKGRRAKLNPESVNLALDRLVAQGRAVVWFEKDKRQVAATPEGLGWIGGGNR